MRCKVYPFATVVIIALALLICVERAGAQSPQGSRLTMGTDTLNIHMVNGRDTVQAGFIVDMLVRSSHGGRRVIVRRYETKSPVLGNRVDSLINDEADLRPRLWQTTGTHGMERVMFDSARARGSVRLMSGQAIAVDVALPNSVIDASSFDLALRASDLKVGAVFHFDAFLSTARAVQPLEASVDASEVIDGVDCWRVRGVFASLPVTFWISRADGKLVRQVLTIGPGVELLFQRRRGPDARSSPRSTE